MAFFIIKDEEKNNKRFTEKKSKKLNDQIEILTETEFANLLVQGQVGSTVQTPVASAIQESIDNERTVVAHFLVGHKSDVYKTVFNADYADTAFGENEVDPNGTVSTANPYNSAGASPFWGVTNQTGLINYLQARGFKRDLHKTLEYFGDYNPLSNSLEVSGFGIDTMYLDKSVIKSLSISPLKTRSNDRNQGLSDPFSTGGSSQIGNRSAFSDPKSFGLADDMQGQYSQYDYSSAAMTVVLEFNVDGLETDIISTEWSSPSGGNLYTDTSVSPSVTYVQEGSIGTLARTTIETGEKQYANVIFQATDSDSNQTYRESLPYNPRDRWGERVETIQEKVRDTWKGYRYFFEIKKHTSPALDYAMNRTFIEKTANLRQYKNLLAQMSFVSGTATLSYKYGFASGDKSPLMWSENALSNDWTYQGYGAISGSGNYQTVTMTNGDVWNMKSGAYVSSVMPAELPNEIALFGVRKQGRFNPLQAIGVYNYNLSVGSVGYYTTYGNLVELYAEKAGLNEFGKSKLIEASSRATGESLQYDSVPSAFNSSTNYTQVLLIKESVLAGIDFSFANVGRSDNNDNNSNQVVTNPLSNQDYNTSPTTQGALFSYVDADGVTQEVYLPYSGTTNYNMPGAAKVFNSNRASHPAEIYEVKIYRYPTPTVETTVPVYETVEAEGGYGEYGDYGYYGGTTSKFIGYNTFTENAEFEGYSIAGVDFSYGHFAYRGAPLHRHLTYGSTAKAYELQSLVEPQGQSGVEIWFGEYDSIIIPYESSGVLPLPKSIFVY